MPDVAPSKKTAGYDPPDRPAAHASIRRGADSGNTSSIARPNTSSRFPIANRAQGLALTGPERDPLSPATRPSTALKSARPLAYVSVSRTARVRVDARPHV